MSESRMLMDMALDGDFDDPWGLDPDWEEEFYEGEYPEDATEEPPKI